MFTGWNKQFTQHPELAGKIHFMPSFFIDIQQFHNFKDVMDGDFNVRTFRLASAAYVRT